MNRLINAVFVTLLSLYYTQSTGQQTVNKLPEIVLTDTQLYYTLADYIAVTNASVVAIFMERANGTYTYLLYNPGFYEFIEDNPPTHWGRWKGRTILFYTGLETITQMQDSTNYKLLLRYLKPVLINQFSPDTLFTLPKAIIVNGRRIKELVVGQMILSHEGAIWRLKVKDGKELSLEKDFDPVPMSYMQINIPYIKHRLRKRPLIVR